MANGMERRDFLKVLGAAGAGASLFGCSTQGAERLLPYVTPQEEIVPGLSTWYRTTCRECPAGCGMNIRTREGRAIKAEGNPLSPISHGRLCARGQASLQGLYNPDRVPQALVRGSAGAWEKIGWDDAEQRLVSALAGASGRKVLLTQTFTGTLDRLIDAWAAAFGVEVIRWDTFGWEALRAGNRLAFGVDAVPVHDFSNADVVISFGADFMETWLSPVDYTHGFVQAQAFTATDGRKGHFISVTAHQSLTDMNADEWLPARPGTEHLVALAMARAIVESGRGQAGAASELLNRVDIAQVAEASGLSEERIRAAGRRFANGGRSLAVGPGVQTSHAAATSVAAAVAVLNYVAGNIGRTVHFDRTERLGETGTYRDLRQLVEAMRAGQVGALLLYGANPLHSVPGGEDVAAALEQVPFIASFATYLDETSKHAHLLLPDHHFLESWGDYEPRTGFHSLIQPVMMPVFSTKQTGDVLLSTARRAGVSLQTGATTYYDYLRERWAQEVYPQAGATAAFDDWWRETLQQGVVVTPAPASPAVSPNAAGLAQLSLEVPQIEGGEYYLVVYPSYRFYDGRLANRPWLQELPDPVSKLSWVSWVEVNPETAKRLGIDRGSLVEVSTPHGRATLPAWIHPGMRPDVISVQLGQGHDELGRYAAGRGVNAAAFLAPIVEESSGGPVWIQTRADLRPTGEWHRIPDTAGSDYQGQHVVAQAIELEEAREAELAAAVVPLALQRRGTPDVGEAFDTGPEHPLTEKVKQLQEAGGFLPMEVEAGPGDFPPPGTYYGEYSEAQPRWGMAIDLERCIGCSACVTACYAENNIGIVGPEQVTKGRILTWMRIERYFEEDESGEFQGTRFLPMLCQQCGNAPCEPVCPVYAAYHTPEGLNAQVYNRCVGTRYCANNCPYKVRYFNWFSYEWPEPLNWQLNPDVTVREKGVMEKCTFCVQRIREAQHQARLEGRDVADGAIVPACAQTCPADAIVFGNIKDPNSRVAQIAASGRGYRVLGELNTQSAIVYLKKVLTEAAEA